MIRLGLRGGRNAARVDRRFAALLGTEPPEAAFLFGAEHEYQVLGPDGETVDFRTVIHDLGLGRARLDPDDPFAYRLPSGNAVTCDESEAEIALAPVEGRPGGASRLVAAAEAERASLAAALPEGLALRGHSTHVSVSVPPELVEPIGRLFAQTLASDLMRLVDSPDRCGLWIRPRSERLELCLDFVDGPRLAAVLSFAAAAVAACLRVVKGIDGVELPPPLRVLARRPRQRSGWHLPRAAFRGDPFDRDGSAPLELLTGGQIAAAEHLAIAWASLWPLARTFASDTELAVADALVDRPNTTVAGALSEPVAGDGADVRPGLLAGAFGEALVPRTRDGYQVAAVALTWAFAVFLVLRPGRWWRRERRAFACVPRSALPAFLAKLDAAALDRVLLAYLSSRPAGRLLAYYEQVRTPGLFDELGLRRALLPPEPILMPRLESLPVGA